VGAQIDQGHVVVPDPRQALIGKAAAYARVSTHKHNSGCHSHNTTRICAGTRNVLTEQRWNQILPSLPYHPPCR
jgi:hypothetical protein